MLTIVLLCLSTFLFGVAVYSLFIIMEKLIDKADDYVERKVREGSGGQS